MKSKIDPATQTLEFADGQQKTVSKSNHPKRTDVWVKAFDGTYRLFLDLPQAIELERKSGYVDKDGDQHSGSIFQVYERLAKGRYQLEGKPVGFAAEGAATVNDCRETVRLGLIGGATGIVDGEKVAVTTRRALELVDTYLTNAPLEEGWALAFLLLDAAINGREPAPYEVGHSNRTPVLPDPAGDPDDAAP